MKKSVLSFRVDSWPRVPLRSAPSGRSDFLLGGHLTQLSWHTLGTPFPSGLLPWPLSHSSFAWLPHLPPPYRPCHRGSSGGREAIGQDGGLQLSVPAGSLQTASGTSSLAARRPACCVTPCSSVARVLLPVALDEALDWQTCFPPLSPVFCFWRKGSAV